MSQLGASIESAEITDGTIQAADLAAGVGGSWTLEKEGTFTAATTLMSATSLTARKYYRLTARVLGSGEDTIYLRFNNDSGNNYEWSRNVDATTEHTAATSLLALSVGETTGYQTFHVYISTDNTGTGFTYVVCDAIVIDSASALKRYLGGSYNAAAAVTRIDLLTGTNMTGQYRLEYFTPFE